MSLIKKDSFLGVTLLELVIVSFVFSLFLIGVYATLDMGMKTWQMGEVKSDVYLKARIALNNIIRDFAETSWLTTNIHGVSPDYNEYLSFGTAINSSTGAFEPDPSNCKPKWQGHIIYFIYQDSTGKKQDLYRRFIPVSPPTTHPIALTEAQILAAINRNEPGQEVLRTVAKDIYDIEFDTKNASLLITLTFKEHIRTEASVIFSPGGDSRKGTEVLEMTTSVTPRN